MTGPDLPATPPSGRGVVFVATGTAHVAAARAAAESVRRSNPGLPVALFGDGAGTGEGFDHLAAIPDPHARSKVDCLARTPFAETLYLDNDVRVMADLGDLFRVLERFDLAAAQVARGHLGTYRRTLAVDVPDAFPQVNSGVMLYRSTPAVTAFLDAWAAAYRAGGGGMDQRSLRETLWLSDLRLAVLPAHYNCRRWTWVQQWLSRRPRPVILHTNRFHPRKAGIAGRWPWLVGPG